MKENFAIAAIVAAVLVGTWFLVNDNNADRVTQVSANRTAAADSKNDGAKVANRREGESKAEGTTKADAKLVSYLQAQWDPIHFKPAIDKATNEQCLACHREILDRKVRPKSPAGVAASGSVAWYQLADTYKGDQTTFHARHLTSSFAKQTMKLKCNFCHRGHDPREEAPGSSKTSGEGMGDFNLRKVVNPSETCLRCHGRFPHEVMDGIDEAWSKARVNFEDEETKNGCLMCHDAEAGGFRTKRHQVNYLKPKAIEKLAKEGSSDSCHGCHGGRAWYRNSYPYPRNSWPDMSEETPDWAKGRPTKSAARDLIGISRNASDGAKK